MTGRHCPSPGRRVPPRRRAATGRPATGRSAGFAALLLAAALVLSAGCARNEDPRAGLAEVPVPDLAAAEPAVREQLGARLAEVERLRADPATPAGELADAYGELGLLYVVYDFVDAAGVAFANAERLDPEDFRWPYLHGYLALLQGDLAGAVPRLERALELSPDLLPALLRLGRARLEQGETDAARALFERALALEPGAAAAHEGLGRVAEVAGDPATAVRHYRRALELEPGASGLHYALGQAYRRLGDLERAEHHLARRGDVPASIPDPLLAGLAASARSGQLFRMQAAEAMENEDYATAAGAWRRAIEEDPKEFEPYHGLAVALQKLGDAPAAQGVLERALADAGTGDEAKDRAERARVHLALAGLLAAGGRDAEAIPHFERSLELAPEQPGVALLLGNALARGGRFEAAVRRYTEVLAAVPPEQRPGVLEKRATARVNLGQREQALADFRAALAAAPEDRGLRLRYAAALEHLGDAAGAARERRAAAALAGGEAAGPRAERARAAVAAGDYEGAAALYRQALEEAGGEAPELRYQLARLLGHLGRYEEAAAEFRRVTDAVPRHAGARHGEVAALLLAGRYGEARMRVNEALRHLSLDRELALVQVRLLASAPDPRVRDGALALEVARRVMSATPDAAGQDALAMAVAESGDPARAAALQSEVVAAARRIDDPSLPRLEARLAAYRAGRPWRAATGAEILTP